MIAMR